MIKTVYMAMVVSLLFAGETLLSADNAIFNCDKQLNELGEKMTETQKVDVENAKTALKDALDRKNSDC